MSERFTSSDSLRSASALRHAHAVTFDSPVELARGGLLPEVTVAYETYGTLDADRGNAVLICHALSGDSHAARHDCGGDDDPGWWDLMVGPGKPVDTRRFFVICANILGGCRGTTGPNSIDHATGRPYGPDFPDVTVEDMVDVQAKLLDHLGIDKLFAAVGGSLGGHQVLCWATRYPQRLHAAVAIATGPHLTAQALAFDVVARNAIIRDPDFHDGRYYDKSTRPNIGLALARMLGHITYLSRQSMADKFDHDKLEPREVTTEFEMLFSVGSYLAYQGDKFVERFDANSYIALSKAMDHFDVGATQEQLADNLGRSDCRWLVLSFTSDWLFPAFQSRQIVDALIAGRKRVCYCNVEADDGHDAFLLPGGIVAYGDMVRAFLETTDPGTSVAPLGTEPVSPPVDVLHRHRVDYPRIIELIEPGSSVLDLGCGGGGLLTRLAHRREAKRLVGVEKDEAYVLQTMLRGFDVMQADLEKGLPDFNDDEFDYAVLSQTLQSLVRTEAIVDEILRVGRRGIVSFPNFAYRKVRDDLYHQGRSPASQRGLLHFHWFNTPNRRFLSVRDWQEFCAARDIRIETAVYLDTESGAEITDEPNLNADLAIFVISRGTRRPAPGLCRIPRPRNRPSGR